MKTTKTAAAYETAEVWNDDGTPKILLRIDGLRQVADGEFELSGVKPRDIDWTAVASALGYEHDMPGDLVDDIAKAVWDSDILQILRSRVKPA